MGGLYAADGHEFVCSSRDGDLEVGGSATDDSEWTDVGGREGWLHAPLADEHVGTSIEVLWDVDLGSSMGRGGDRL